MRVILSKLGVLGAVCGAALLMISAGPSLGQSAPRSGGPAELPPAGFTGQQYVDSRGCIFMRAGLGGQVNWVPRIGADRKPICAQVTPKQAAERLESTAAKGADAPGAPLRTIASDMKSTPALGVVTPVPVPGLSGGPAASGAAMQAAAPQIAAAQTSPAPQISGVSTGCPAAAPKLEYFPLSTGGQVAVCTRGDGTATGWVSPQFTPASGQGAALRMAGQGISSGKSHSAAAPQAAQVTSPAAPPKGYQAAWPDDRLNPNRAKGTQAGQHSQAQIWTNTVPAQLATPAPSAAQVAAQTPDLSLASRTQGTGLGAQALFVQVGTFGQPSNAQNAAARLSGLGLPVATSKGARGGKALVVVLAGPFASVQQAQAALSSLRSAGFHDAFLR